MTTIFYASWEVRFTEIKQNLRIRTKRIKVQNFLETIFAVDKSADKYSFT